MIPEPQRTYLLELLGALGSTSESMVLVGGQALRFMVDNARPTRDLDFLLDVLRLQSTDASLASALDSLGYQPVTEARNFQFTKPIPNSSEVMRVEFMAPSELAHREGIRVDVQEGLHGRACAGGSIVLAETDVKDISGTLPGGTPCDARIRVTRPNGLILLKLLAMDDRYRNVRGPAHARHDREEAAIHASDIVAVLSAQPDPAELRDRFVAQFGARPDLKATAFRIIKDYFGNANAPGLLLYRESLAASTPISESVRDLDPELRRVQRLVFTLLPDE